MQHAVFEQHTLAAADSWLSLSPDTWVTDAAMVPQVMIAEISLASCQMRLAMISQRTGLAWGCHGSTYDCLADLNMGMLRYLRL